MNLVATLTDELNQQGLWEDNLLLKRNEYLVQHGQLDTNLYLILEGSVRIFVMDGHDEHVIRFGYRDNIITALDAFITQKPTELFIQAIKKTSLKAISKSVFLDFVYGSLANIKLWQTILGSLIHQQMEREMDLLTSSPVERYHRVLARSPRLFQEIPHKHIASYLRMTPETLSRIKKQ